MKGIAQAMRRVITGSTLACLAVSAQAGGALDLSLADDAVRVAYDATQAGSGLHINLSALHHMDDGNMLGAGVHVVDLRKPHSNLYIGLGAKVPRWVSVVSSGQRYRLSRMSVLPVMPITRPRLSLLAMRKI